MRPSLPALIAGNPDVRELLLGTFSCSPYLSALSLRDPRSLADCLTLNPETHLKDAQAALAASIDEAPSSKEVMAHLRQFKRRMALLAALADVGQVWTTGACLEAMSLTADAALKAAIGFLFRKAREAGQVTAGEGTPEPRGYFIIAMGKLGAMELNYSSDIDFMVFYDDGARGARAGRRAVNLLREADARAGAPAPGAYRPTAMCSAPISGSGPIPARRRSRSRPTQGSPITRASARTGNARR